MMEMQDRFYQDGGCLPPNMPSYITREADAELEKYLKDDNFCYILTVHQRVGTKARHHCIAVIFHELALEHL